MDDSPGTSWWEILAGACGAIIPIALRAGLTPRQVVAMGFVGLALAVFGGPALFDWGNIHNPQFRAFLTLVIGMGGMRGAEAVLKWWSASADGIVAGVMSRLSRSRGANLRGKERRKNRERRKTNR